MPQQPQAQTVQIKDLLARYRGLNLKDETATKAFAKAIADSSIPSYHKDVLAVGLLTVQEGETVLTLSMLREQEKMRHLEALLNIEKRVLDERIKKQQAMVPTAKPT
jgi:hypothetical protein